MKANLPATTAGRPVEVWFMGEAPAANAPRFGESASKAR